jgi:septum formation protein
MTGPLVLASGSPRRRVILFHAGVPHEVVPPRVEEIGLPGELPDVMSVRLARQKAREVAGRVGGDRWVLGVDTVVSIDDRILGKPIDEADAVGMLLMLSNRSHTVFSGYALIGFGREHIGSVASKVTMRAVTRAEAAAYAATGEPLDKAGAYAIQESARRFITSVEGSEFNVAGLPLEVLLPILSELDLAGPGETASEVDA